MAIDKLKESAELKKRRAELRQAKKELTLANRRGEFHRIYRLLRRYEYALESVYKQWCKE